MSTLKTRISQDDLHNFFEIHLNLPDVAYETIEEGETSQAYFYESPDGSRVLRINSHTQEGFQKDDFAARHFAGGNVAIPQTFEIGEISPGVFFSITERAQGRMLSRFSVEETNDFMPVFMKTLDAIHATKPAGGGYGWWDITGKGRFNSWAEAVRAMQSAEDDYNLAGVSFFDQALHDELKVEVNRLGAYCPDARMLLHGDFGYKNTLADDHQITGVIDWHGSMYGDPLFDISWLDFWRAEQGFAEQFREHYAAQGKDMKNYDERMKCYSLLHVVSSMAFFAKSDQQEKYNFSLQRLKSL